MFDPRTASGPSDHEMEPFQDALPQKSVDELGPDPFLPTIPTKDESHVLMARYVLRQATRLGWVRSPETRSLETPSSTCVALQTTQGDYVFEPPNTNSLLTSAIRRLNDKIAFTMASEITASVIRSIPPQQKYLSIEQAGIRIPIISSLENVGPSLVFASRCCILLKEKVVLVWSDDVGAIVETGTEIEQQLLSSVFGSKIGQTLRTPHLSKHGSIYSSSASSAYKVPITSLEEKPPAGGIDKKDEVYVKAIALEEGENDELPPRPLALFHAIRTGCVVLLVIVSQLNGVAKLLNEYYWDGGTLRFCLIASMPPFALFSLFFFNVVVNSVFQLFLPLGPALQNTKYHSAIKPKPARHRDYELPHITVQMPVYKEGLLGVIVPTIISVIAAIQDYEKRGGTASVFINDDGMQAIEPELAEARKKYYRENNIGYCARLPNMKTKKARSWFSKSAGTGQDGEGKNIPPPQSLANQIGFERKGKFKKASNMNYCLDFSNRVEDEMVRLSGLRCDERGCTEEDLTVEDDDELYEEALGNVLRADEGRTWAGGNVRIGELILIIDCDTRVPVDCLIYGALEMRESPEVAIIQHGSGVMQVAHNLFENGITYFTNMVYTSIKYGVGTGDVAPFVGHNAFLRWKAIQSIGFVDPTDSQMKWWSDRHVSEDFDISLRLQGHGMVVRLATYDNGEFKEGVSLTLYDELTRWEKYAYGCNELVFNPIHQWIYKGPITRLFLRFLFGPMPVTSKITIIAYICSYYAIASALLLTTVSYVVVGLWANELDHEYLPSWEIWLSLVVVFNAASVLAFSVLRHRMREAKFLTAITQAVKWVPFMFMFFSGISLNCSKALLCHMFSINIEWSSTAKEVGPSGIYVAMDKMVKFFKFTWIIVGLLAAGMIYMAFYAPWGWKIAPGLGTPAVFGIIPMAIQVGGHFLLPFTLGL